MQKANCISIFSIILGTALADSPSFIPSALLIVFGIVVFIGAKLCTELDL